MADKATFSTPQQFVANAAQKLLKSGMNVNALRTNALLRKDEWIEIDREVVAIARARLTGVADLQALGLTHSLGGLGTLISQYEAASDMTPANVDMAGVTRGEEDDQEFDLRSVPIPIVHKDFRINIRRLEASRRLGDSIDTTQAATASRRVSDGLESMLFKGVGISIQGGTIYGYTTHPDRNTGTAVGAWSTIGNIYPTVLDMVRKAHEDHMYGPYYLYVASDVWPDLLAVHDDGSGQTALDRVKRIPSLREVKTADELPDGNLILIQMTKDVVDLAVAQDITPIEWQTEGGMVSNFKIMSAMAPRLKSDYDGRCGIVHYTGA